MAESTREWQKITMDGYDSSRGRNRLSDDDPPREGPGKKKNYRGKKIK